ncbi:hypothetical protein Q5M85_02365 [Paraclostridium bifermentans]|nr:hypothetical protein [Paraclostridium bifermentans]
MKNIIQAENQDEYKILNVVNIATEFDDGDLIKINKSFLLKLIPTERIY